MLAHQSPTGSKNQLSARCGKAATKGGCTVESPPQPVENTSPPRAGVFIPIGGPQAHEDSQDWPHWVFHEVSRAERLSQQAGRPVAGVSTFSEKKSTWRTVYASVGQAVPPGGSACRTLLTGGAAAGHRRSRHCLGWEYTPCLQRPRAERISIACPGGRALRFAGCSTGLPAFRH
jgi:hypothetical protein